MKLRNLLSLFTVILLTASCGGGGGSVSSEQTPDTAKTGVFTDDPVVGICYSTSSGIVGQTDENGEFRYNPGDIVKFYLASNCKDSTDSVVVGSTTGQSVVTPVDLVADDTTNPQEIKEKVEVITAFLYSISQKEDGKWKVDPQKALTVAQKLQLKDLENTTDSTQVLQTLGVDVNEIYQHLNETLLNHARETINHMEGKEITLQIRDSSGNISSTDTCQIINVEDTSNGFNITLNCDNNGEVNLNIYANEGLLYVSSGSQDNDELITNIDDSGICTINKCLLVTDQFSEDLYEETLAVLKKLNGKRVAFFDSEGDGGSCTLVVNSQNPAQFKFIDCDNPEDNDNTWENLKVENGKVIAVDENGVETQILYIDPKELKVFYSYEDNGSMYTGFLMPVSSEETPTTTTTPSSSVEELYKDTVEVLKELNNKEVIFSDDESTCTVVVNPDNPSEFKLINCSDEDMNDTDWEKLYITDNNELVAEDEDGAITVITGVDKDKRYIYYKYEDDNGEWVSGYLSPVEK